MGSGGGEGCDGGGDGGGGGGETVARQSHVGSEKTKYYIYI